MKDLYGVALPALGDTSCAFKARACGPAPPGLAVRLAAGLVLLQRLLLPSCAAAAAAAAATSLCLPTSQPCCLPLPSLRAALQAFLLPFDPEDHEDADEWKAWEGELSARELHKARRGQGGHVVGRQGGRAAGRGPRLAVPRCTACVATFPLLASLAASHQPTCRGPALSCFTPPQAALELFPAAGIAPVTADTAQQWGAADAAAAKVLLFTDKEEPPALFRALRWGAWGRPCCRQGPRPRQGAVVG